MLNLPPNPNASSPQRENLRRGQGVNEIQRENQSGERSQGSSVSFAQDEMLSGMDSIVQYDGAELQLRYLLKQSPDSQIAITHDSVWCSVMHQDWKVFFGNSAEAERWKNMKTAAFMQTDGNESFAKYQLPSTETLATLAGNDENDEVALTEEQKEQAKLLKQARTRRKGQVKDLLMWASGGPLANTSPCQCHHGTLWVVQDIVAQLVLMSVTIMQY
ncbi:hypothetical protein K435DRAFT_797865 [Dendrothele bispora CBS 962.96]|uniref:Uncharacterized protein n=1 Tax=Dendrothele bispora (strain CBS 962.96) TaxID=1314807 RepID=A0A4S8M131_DENBC|nr:hypothetical protein K435DRAFT_797865 [Dendrothele bispora CBS 962.96]